MDFYKTVSFGNDFIHVNQNDCITLAGAFGIGIPVNGIDCKTLGELSRRICVRETGAGADGVIYYDMTDRSVPFSIYNRDGSRAEISGNGMAGLASVLFYSGHCTGEALLESSVGPRRVKCLLRNDNQFRLNVELGIPDFENRAFFPFLKNNVSQYEYDGIQFYPVSVGNPHVVVIMDKKMSAELRDNRVQHVRLLGKKLAQAALFPQGTNVEWVLPAAAGNLEPDYPGGRHFSIFYYERGVGMTGSSSTGSAAVFAVLRHLGMVSDKLSLPIPNWQPDGADPIKISGKNEIFVESSTKIVYKGRFLGVNSL